MAITFGGITEDEKKGMFGKILDMMNRMAGKPELSDSPEMPETDEEEESEIFEKSTPLALECNSIEDAVCMSKLFSGKDKVPQSAFYKMQEKYYLLMDFKGFSKQEIKPLAFAAVEYNNRRIATQAGIAYIKEHGKCILAQDAICDLVQL